MFFNLFTFDAMTNAPSTSLAVADPRVFWYVQKMTELCHKSVLQRIILPLHVILAPFTWALTVNPTVQPGCPNLFLPCLFFLLVLRWPELATPTLDVPSLLWTRLHHIMHPHALPHNSAENYVWSTRTRNSMDQDICVASQLPKQQKTPPFQRQLPDVALHTSVTKQFLHNRVENIGSAWLDKNHLWFQVFAREPQTQNSQ